jgi:methyl-accepting chemotaxis protein
MRLTTRILLGYWYLVILLVIIAVGAALGFHSLGENIGRVLTENFESVRASTAMLESLERQDSAVLAALLGKRGADEVLTASESSFRQALERARGNITIPEEAGVIEGIEQSFSAFLAARDELLGAAPESPLRAYDEETFPRFERVKAEVLHLLEINHQAMKEADRRAQETASGRAVLLALMVLLAFFSLAFLSRALNRTVLERLDELAKVTEAIAGGSLDRRAAAQYSDELGAVARQLNASLDRQQQARTEVEGRVALYRELVIALLGSLPQPAAVVGPDGRILASTLAEDTEEHLAAAWPGIPRLERGAGSGSIEVTLGAETLSLRVLHGTAERPVAWLAERR